MPAHGRRSARAHTCVLLLSICHVINCADQQADDAPITVAFTLGDDQAVAEDSGAQTVLAFATGITPESGAERTVSFDLSNDDNALFSTQPSIDATGTLIYTPAPDANGATTITVTGTASGATSATQTFTITVHAVNDAPVNTVPPAQTTNEDVALALNTLAVSDVDAGTIKVTLTVLNGTVTFGALAGLTVNGNGTAAVDATGSVANINAALQTLTFTPTANLSGLAQITMLSEDQGGAGAGGPMADSDAVDINVLAVNDAPVVNATAFSIPENSADDTFVGTVTFTDPEAGDTHALAITGGNTSGAFAIDAGTGQITVANSAALSFETTQAFDLTISVTDSSGAGNATGSATITINLTDVNEVLAFTSSAIASMPENTTAAATVTAIDPDGAAVDYSITGGAHAALFSIDSSTGALTFNAPPDFEAPSDGDANNGYVVAVTASDGTYNPTQVITVTVTDVNEAPAFTSSSAASAQENSIAAVTVITTSDPEGNAITYSISGGADAAMFSINTQTGALGFTGLPDFELPSDADGNNVYDVIVRASDGTNNPTQAIAVTVTNAGDGAPAVWEGDVDASWTTVGNWQGDQPPQPGSPVFFMQAATFDPSASSPGFALGSVTLGGTFIGTVNLTQPLSVGDLVIGAGTSVNTNGNALVARAISGGGTLTATGGTVTTSGGVTVTTFNAGTSLTFTGPGTWGGASSFGNVVVFGGVALTLGSAVTAGNLSIATGATLRLTGQPLTVAGTTTVSDGATLLALAPITFGSSVTVGATGTLDLRGNTTFAGPLSVAGRFLARSNAITLLFPSGGLASFDAGSTVRIAPPSGVTDLLATTSGVAWQLQLATGATQTFTRVRVEDSDVVGTVDPVSTLPTSIDLGGNDIFPTATPGWKNLQ